VRAPLSSGLESRIREKGTDAQHSDPR
jgi:hypothetical protein